MIIAHLSDLHLSRFGTNLMQVRRLAGQANRRGWETLRQEGHWRIDAHRAEGRRLRRHDRLRLVDPTGLVHRVATVRRGDDEQSEIARLAALMTVRVRLSSECLARHFPSVADVAELLAADPDNVDLRFCALVHQLRADRPDWVIITGDLTDDAVGYELIEAGLAPFIEARRLVCVPGNHDIYASPRWLTPKRLRKTETEKRRRWAAFSTRIGLPAGGSFVHDLGEGAALACLDSTHPPKIPASASGLVPPHELDRVHGAFDARGNSAVRLACVHHHIINPPLGAIGKVPMQAGMRLRNAKRVLDAMKALGCTAVMNGHRHLGYRYHPAASPLFLSAPSATLGCRSGIAPFYWRISLSRKGLDSVHDVPVQALAL